MLRRYKIKRTSGTRPLLKTIVTWDLANLHPKTIQIQVELFQRVQYSSAGIVEYYTTGLTMCPSWSIITAKYPYIRLRNIIIGQWNIEREWPRLWNTIHPSTSKDVFGYVAFYNATCYSPSTTDHTLVSCINIKLWIMLWWASLGPMAIVGQHINATE